MEVEKERNGIHQLVNRLQLQTHQNTMRNMGVAGGAYDKNHKILRQRWYQATTRLMSSDQLHQLVDFSARQIVENIELEMRKKNGGGIDPKRVFMSATLNVATSFLLNDRLEFGEPEQVMICEWIEVKLFASGFVQYFWFQTIFNNFPNLFICTIWTQLFPSWMIRRGIPRRLLELVRPNIYSTRDMVYREFYPFIIKKLKQHEDNLDPDNPQDFVDFLILENRQNPDIAYQAICSTLIHLYNGAGDTLTTTMRWLCVLMSLHTDIQERCFTELDACHNANQRYIEKECPFVCATLAEVTRYRPVSDSLPHLVSSPVEINGNTIRKGTAVVASLTAIMHDASYFKQPDQFNPERFIENGVFVRDQRVCNFSVGLRNCVGKKMAQVEFFSFAAHILHKFRLRHVKGHLEPIKHNSLLKPDDFEIEFVER